MDACASVIRKCEAIRRCQTACDYYDRFVQLLGANIQHHRKRKGQLQEQLALEKEAKKKKADAK